MANINSDKGGELAEEDEFDPFKNRLWKAMSDVMHDNEISKERIRAMENIVERQVRWSEDVAETTRDIRNRLEANSLKLNEALTSIAENRKEIDRLWAFPVKLVGMVISVGGASAVIWKVASWLLSDSALDRLGR